MRPRTILLVGAFAAIGLGLLVSQDALSHYEEPIYELLKKDGNFEIRKYPELISAEVVVAAGSNAENEAFKILAGYIFGKNRSSEKIAMTIPVTMESSKNARGNQSASSERISMTAPVASENSEAGLRMRFFMPSEYTLETLPVPQDQRIKLQPVPSQTYAVIKFSGFLTKKNADKQKAELRKHLEKLAYKTTGEPQTTAYNPPWTLPFLRRNEIWMAIDY